jgi:hypothetical protein
MNGIGSPVGGRTSHELAQTARTRCHHQIKEGVSQVPPYIGIVLDSLLQTMLSIFEFSWSWFSQLSQEVGARFGTWGLAGLYLLAMMTSIWLLYQLFRILAFILFRVVLPLVLVAFSLFLLFLLSS